MTLPTGLCLAHPWQQDESGLLPAEQALSVLQPQWWYNWKYDHLDDPSYVPHLWDASPGATDKFIAAMQGQGNRLCFIQNEPSTQDQAVRTPGEVVSACKRIKAETNLQLCGPNASITFDFELNWLTNFAQLGGIEPLDAIGIHIHGLNTADDWLAAWQRWKGWYALYGQNKPVIVTETCGTTANFAQVDMMAAIAELTETDPVLQAAFWYCSQQHFFDKETGIWEPYWEHSWLIDSLGIMTTAGLAFRELQEAVGQTGGEDHLIYLPSVQGAGV